MRRIRFLSLVPLAAFLVASDGSFESPPLGPGGEWTHRFRSVGEHEYFVKEDPTTRGRAIAR